MNVLKSQPKLIVQLTGGLGNQMFQYATARSLAERSDAELVLDTWSGFVRDRQYRRNYELDAFPVAARKANPLERLPFWIDRALNKVWRQTFQPVSRRWSGVFIREPRLEFLPEVHQYQIKGPCWMTGLWQTARYFEKHESLIRRELMPSIPNESHFCALGQTMREVNSVALGVRLYEESNNPGNHASDGRLKSVAAINEAARQIADRRSNLHFFIFCTHRSPVLEQLHLNGDVTYVTHDDGYNGSLEGLWMLTQCRHHIFTNSSFYWWGAWLSRNNYSVEQPDIFAADNFTNKDAVLPQWQMF